MRASYNDCKEILTIVKEEALYEKLGRDLTDEEHFEVFMSVESHEVAELYRTMNGFT